MKVERHENCLGAMGCAKQLQYYLNVQQKWLIDWKGLLKPFCGII